jgi:sugar lactone lactonase YvrE
MNIAARPRISAVQPLWAVEGGRVTVVGDALFTGQELPEVRIGTAVARVASAAPHAVTVVVPPGLDGGRTPIRLANLAGETAYVDVGAPLATGLHQVDSPAFDPDGNLYVTYSGSRGQQSPVSIYVVRRDGTRQPFVSDLPNPTSLTFGPDGDLYVSSRFDGSVYRVDRNGTVATYATHLGVACGIAFGPDGRLYVGDRSGSILAVSDGRATQFAAIPPSVAAFHLAFGPDGALYVAAPTLAPRDVIYRVLPSGDVDVFAHGFGRPQGLAVDSTGTLYVVDAVAGDSALYRLKVEQPAVKERVVEGGSLIGVAFDPLGGLALASNDTVYRFEGSLPPIFG